MDMGDNRLLPRALRKPEGKARLAGVGFDDIEARTLGKPRIGKHGQH